MSLIVAGPAAGRHQPEHWRTREEAEAEGLRHVCTGEPHVAVQTNRGRGGKGGWNYIPQCTSCRWNMLELVDQINLNVREDRTRTYRLWRLK